MKTTAKKKNSQGNILAALLFVMLFCTLSITLLTHSIGHQRIMRIRTLRSRALLSLRNDLNLEIHHLFSTANLADLEGLSHPAREIFSADNFPNHQTQMTDLSHRFSFTDSTCAGFTRHDVRDRIRAALLRTPYVMEGEVQCRILNGSVPLRLIPVSLTGELSGSESARDWLSRHNIRTDPSIVPLVRKTPLKLDIKSMALKALTLDGEELTWSEIRSRLDMPVMEAPPPPGVYLLKSRERIDAVLVQGDLDRLEFSRTNAGQLICLHQGGDIYRLEYEPEGTVVDCWDTAPISTTIFSECIVVNGNCLQISTQLDEDESAKAFHPDSDIVLLVSGKAAVTSSLESDHLGVRSTSPPGLTMVSGKSGILSNGGGGVHMDTERNANLDVSLITADEISSTGEEVKIRGTLCAGKLENKGEIRLEYAAGENRVLDSLLAHNIRLVQRIFLNRMEEVYDER